MKKFFKQFKNCSYFVTMEGYIPCVERPTNSSNEIQSPGNRSKFLGISPLKEVTNISTPTDRPFRVSIEGNIGAGKSTLIEYFKSYPEIEAYGVMKFFYIFKILTSNTFFILTGILIIFSHVKSPFQKAIDISSFLFNFIMKLKK